MALRCDSFGARLVSSTDTNTERYVRSTCSEVKETTYHAHIHLSVNIFTLRIFVYFLTSADGGVKKFGFGHSKLKH